MAAIILLRGFPLSLSVITQGHSLGVCLTRAGHLWLVLTSPVLEVRNFGRGHSHSERLLCFCFVGLRVGRWFEETSPVEPLRGCVTVSIFETAM